MADVLPSQLANDVLSKLYDVLTNGDATVPMSQDNYFSWATPGIPITPDDFRFLTQGFTGVLTPASAALWQQAKGGGNAAASSGGGTATATAGLTSADIDKLLASDTAQLYMQAENFARLVDFVPEVNATQQGKFAQLAVMNNVGTLSDVYEFTLRMCQVMETKLDDATVAKIAKFRGLLQTTTTKTDLITGEQTQVTGPSPLVQVYTEKMSAYINAALDYNSHRIDALSAANPQAVNYWAINASLLRDKVSAAMDDWVTNGYKDDYEEIAAYIDQVMGRDMTLLLAQYKQDLQNAKLTGSASGSDFYYTSLVPGDFATATGWTSFGFSSGEIGTQSNFSSKYSSMTANGGASFLGIFGGGGSHSQNSGSSQFTSAFNSDVFNLSFQMCQVPIVRPWFKTAFLNSKTWRFAQNNPDSKDAMLNDGKTPPAGLMPAYPTTMIFVKNLSLTLGTSSSFSNWYSSYANSSSSGGGFVSFGPFCLGGSASVASGDTQHHYDSDAKWDGQTISVPGMQVAGYKCHVLPQSPNPSPSITSWV